MNTPRSEAAAGAAPEPMLPRPMAIHRVRRELPRIFTFELEPGEGGFAFAPGQFNMLYVPGQGEVPISISGDPQRPEVLVHTVRAVGKATEALCALKKGQILGVRGPFGSAWPVESLAGRDLVLATSGLGLAPLRPALYHVLNHRRDYGRVTLVYGARNPDRLLYREELSGWMGRFDLEVMLAVGSAGREWAGHIGTATNLIAKVEVDPANAAALICSSERMMRAMADELGGLGIADEHIHLSLERDMQCGLGLCGHCQLGPLFICKDGPVFSLDAVRRLISIREL